MIGARNHPPAFEALPRGNSHRHPRHPRHLRRRGQAGFTLVELVGVLSIAVLLASLAVGPALRQLRAAEQEAEALGAEAIGKAFEKFVLEQKRIPSTNDWIELLAPELDVPASRVAATRAGIPRRLLFHPASTLQPGIASRPQTIAGFPVASNGTDRVLILGTLHGPFPTNLVPNSVPSFEAVWNTRPHERPAGWSEQALPDPDDLQIVKIDLARLLHRVTVNNLSATNLPVRISLAANGTMLTISKSTPSTSWQSRFIHGTDLNLHAANGGLFGTETVTADRTLYFGDDGWGGRRNPQPADNIVATLAADFLAASFPEAKNLQRPRPALDELYRALWSYMEWADAGFPEGGNNKNQAPAVYVVRSTVARLNQGTLNLIGSGGGGGGGDDDDDDDDDKDKKDK